jgi:hypothetical protein
MNPLLGTPACALPCEFRLEGAKLLFLLDLILLQLPLSLVPLPNLLLILDLEGLQVEFVPQEDVPLLLLSYNLLVVRNAKLLSLDLPLMLGLVFDLIQFHLFLK